MYTNIYTYVNEMSILHELALLPIEEFEVSCMDVSYLESGGRLQSPLAPSKRASELRLHSDSKVQRSRQQTSVARRR
jgi:hypothetical protein